MLVDCKVPTGGKVLVKMGSDILSKWVGGTEENIRAAFAEAEAENVRNLTVQVFARGGRRVYNGDANLKKRTST